MSEEDYEIIEESYEIGDVVGYIPPGVFTVAGKVRQTFSADAPPIIYGQIVEIFMDADNDEWVRLEIWNGHTNQLEHLDLSWDYIILAVGRAVQPN